MSTEKTTNSPHLVATNAGLGIAVYIFASIVALWVAFLLMGDSVTVH